MGSSAFLLPIAYRGLYREMLTAAWRRHCRLPNDPEAIQRAIGCTSAEWRKLWPRVQPFWRVDGAFLVNDTQLEIYAEAKRREALASARGKKGANARWHPEETDDGQCTSNAQASLGQWPPSPKSVQVLQERTAPGAPRPPRPKPSEWRRAVAIAHLVMERHPDSFTDCTELFKLRCAEQGIDYGQRKDGRPLYARALDYVAEVRAQRKGAHRHERAS